MTKIWVLTDGNAGNLNPAMALADTIQVQIPDAEIEDIRVNLKAAFKKLPAWLMPLSKRLLYLMLANKSLPKDSTPNIIIGAGRKSAPYVAMIAKKASKKIKTIQILNPKMPFKHFDHLIIPAHDQVVHPKVMATIGSLNMISEQSLKAAHDAWQDKLPIKIGNFIAVLIGGSSGSASMTESDIDTLIDNLTTLNEANSIYVTVSRRSPKELTMRLHDAGIWVWDGEGENPYLGLLALADKIIVTADSVNMASEAAATGKPVYIAELSKISPKLQRFHQSLNEYGASRPLSAINDTWEYPPLRETETVASKIIKGLD